MAATALRAARLARRPLVVALVGEETPATRSYLRIKSKKASEAGCDFQVRPLPPGGQSLLDMTSDADAVIVQLPLGEGFDAHTACDALPITKDADVLSSGARISFERGDAGALLPPVVGAVQQLLTKAGYQVAGKRAVVVGEGFLVGAPVAAWLRREGADVTVVTKETPDLFEPLSVADLVVSGAGVPGLITPEVLKQGVVLIDAGTSEVAGELRGDADPACADKCSFFTPVPGGVGPVAVACLFDNVVTLVEARG